MFESIKTRYEKGWIREDQLQRYVDLGVITADEAGEIKGQ